ncbi:TPA: hypothetical protein I8Y81_000299 [Legionella pneumophila]|nr:hypothetical protein [Legionella pneumophila]
MLTAFFTLIFGVISGYFFNVIAMCISFKQRTIDNEIKVYDALIANWVEMRNLIYHDIDTDKWLKLDKLYERSQTYIGESFLLSDDQTLLEDINNFNEQFVRTNWHELSLDSINEIMEKLKINGLGLIQRMKADIHESSKLTRTDLTQIFSSIVKDKR